MSKRRKKRLPFDRSDLDLLFGSKLYTRQLRSKGQSREASYWIAILMFYTGARPEEIAGLALTDIREHPALGWYFDIVDRPSPEDADLFDPDGEHDDGLYAASARTGKHRQYRYPTP